MTETPGIQILVDDRSHQAIRHLGTESMHYPGAPDAGKWQGQRLAGLEADLAARQMGLVFGELSEPTLGTASVAMLTGRSDYIPHTETELEALSAFHQRGGAVFLMASHAGLVLPQKQVAMALGLGVDFHEVTRLNRCPEFADPQHETLRGCSELRIRTSCEMTTGADLTVTVADQNEAVGALAAASDPSGPAGRIMVTTSGGHIASLDDSMADMYSSSSNSTWTMNTIEWLCAS